MFCVVSPQYQAGEFKVYQILKFLKFGDKLIHLFHYRALLKHITMATSLSLHFTYTTSNNTIKHHIMPQTHTIWGGCSFLLLKYLNFIFRFNLMITITITVRYLWGFILEDEIGWQFYVTVILWNLTTPAYKYVYAKFESSFWQLVKMNFNKLKIVI